MSIQIKGIDNLLKKLNKLSNIETKEAVVEVAKDMQEGIQDEASKFSVKAEHIKACDPRIYGNSCYVDVGLKGDNFEEWKELYYQNYGFDDYGWNFKGQIHISNHLMWFDEKVQSMEKEIKRKLRNKVKEQIKECWNG